MALALIASHNQGTQVVYLTPQNFTAAFVRQPVYISETMGSAVRMCSLKYNFIFSSVSRIHCIDIH